MVVYCYNIYVNVECCCDVMSVGVNVGIDVDEESCCKDGGGAKVAYPPAIFVLYSRYFFPTVLD